MVTKYIYFRSNLQTGDVILFSGKGLISRIIQLFTGSKISHVGMVVRNKLLDEVLILESDVNRNDNGVQLNNLGRRIKNYKGKIYLRRLKTERTSKMLFDLESWIQNNRETSYEKGLCGLWELICSAIDFWLFKNKPNPNRLFCSELITIIYQLWNLLPADLIANETVPNNFWLDNFIDYWLRFSTETACLDTPEQIR